MADGLHEIYFGATGSALELVHVPPARVTAATYAIEDLTESELASGRFLVAAGTAATVDTFDATTTAVAGPRETDPRLATFGAVGSPPTVGRAYVIETADGRLEKFRAVASTTTTIRRKSPFAGTFATGSHVRGLQIAATFPQAAAADADRLENDEPCRVTWTYTIAGITLVVSEYIRLTRSRAEVRHAAELELALQEGWAEVVQGLGVHGHLLGDVVKYAVRRVEARLRGKGIDPVNFFAGQQGFEVLLQRCVLHLAELGHHPKSLPAETFKEDQRREFQRLWDHLTVGQVGVGATDVDRVNDTAPSGPATRVRNPFVRM